MKYALNEITFRRSWLVLGLISILVPQALFIAARSAGRRQGTNSSAYFQGYTSQSSNPDIDYKVCSFLWGCQREGGYGEAITKSVLALVYFMTASLNLAIVLLGFAYDEEISKGGQRTLLLVLLATGYLSLAMFLLTGSLEGVVSIEGEEFDRNGWFGQVGVLLSLTTLLWSIFAATFAMVLRKKIVCCYTRMDTIDDYTLHSDAPTKFYFEEKGPRPPRRTGSADSMPGKVAMGRMSSQKKHRFLDPAPFLKRLQSLARVTEESKTSRRRDPGENVEGPMIVEYHISGAVSDLSGEV